MFEVGDKVRCVCSDGYVLKDGKTYTVERCLGKYVYVGTGPSDGWDAHRFELVEGSCLIPVEDIPDGWEAVRVGTPQAGDWYVGDRGKPSRCSHGFFAPYPKIVVRRTKPETRPVSGVDVGKKVVCVDNSSWTLHTYGKQKCLCVGGGKYEILDTESLKVVLGAEETSGE